MQERGRGARRRRAEIRLMSGPRDRLIVALDVPSVEDARALVETLGDSVGVYKIGLELLFSGRLCLGARARRPRSFGVRRCEAARHRGDGRAGDGGHRDERASRSLPCMRSTRRRFEAAVRGRGDSPLKLLGVTVLTNLSAARSRPAEHRPSLARGGPVSRETRQGSRLRRRDRLGPRGGFDPQSVGTRLSHRHARGEAARGARRGPGPRGDAA